MRFKFAILVLALAALAGAAARPAAAQQRATAPQDEDWCQSERSGDDDQERFCEVREYTLPADREVITVDAAPNGGIRVESWERNEILVRAKVATWADSESEARAMAEDIEVGTGATISSSGPRAGNDEGWSVSFRLYVPKRSNLRLETLNGGIAITGVAGRTEFETTNGSVKLSALEGDVLGHTTNGSVQVELSGSSWTGERLDVETTNGSVKLRVPADYSAHLETGTVNGTFRVDFPITVQGRLDTHRLSVDLGRGGKTVRAVTTNGSVVVERV
jgi:hypothetical protein